MADQFGASHRKLIEDTNNGKVAAAPKAPTTSVAVTGARHTVHGSDGKSQLYKSLTSFGQEVVTGMAKRQQKRDYVEGFNKGLDEGFAENERSPLRDAIFGPSATLRGAQERIVQNDSRRWLNARMSSMTDDIKSMDEDEYQAELTGQLQNALEDHDDPDIRAQITEMASKQFGTLARNHAQQRQVWIDVTAVQSVEDTMNAGILGMRNAQQYGDFQAQKDAQLEANEMFDQPLDMNSDRWLETVNSVVMANLNKGDDLAFRLAEQKGIVAMMTPSEQARLESVYAVYDKKNGRKFHTAQTSLMDRINKGTANDSDLVAFKAKYPEQGKDLNTLRDDKVKQDAILAEIARQKALTIDELVSGDVKFASRSTAEQREAVSSTFNAIADDGLRATRADMFDKGEYDGDMNAPFTPEQRMDFMLDNPMQFAQTWAQHPEVKTPMVQNLATSMISDIRREDLDEQGIEVLTRRFEALKQFQALDGGNFHSQFRSEEDASTYAAYSYLVNDAGWNPINAIREMRTIGDREPIEISDYTDEIDDATKDLEDSFLDQSPESQGWWGLYNKTPDNEQVFNQELKSQLEKSLSLYKGDMSKALPAAQAVIRRNGIVSNGQFIPNGRKLDIKGGSLEDYIRGINADDEMRRQITNHESGFAADVDYTTLELSVNPWNKKAVIMHGRHEVTGQPTTISLNLPQHGSHFSTYGFNSFTGYNPNIADTEERKAAFLRNNRLLSTYKTIGRAIEKSVQ